MHREGIKALTFLIYCIVKVIIVSIVGFFFRLLVPLRWRTPYSPNDISTQWLTQRMRRTGFLGPKQRVSNIKVRPLQSEGRGFTSVLYELNMEYSPVSVSDSEPLIPPASLVCKVLCPTFAAKVVSVASHFASEVQFYSSFASNPKLQNLGFRVPRVVCAEQFMETDFMLIIEKIETVKAYRCNPPWNKPEDVQMDLFERIILGVARFHAAFFKTKACYDFWSAFGAFGRAESPMILVWRLVRKPSWYNKFSEFFVPGLDMFRLTRAAVKGPVFARTLPQTILHGDIRLSNYLWEKNPGASEPSPVLLDWQLVSRGKPGADLGVLMAWDLPIETRREHEMRLLDLYLAEFRRCGVSEESLTREDLIKQYKIGLCMRGLSKAVLGSKHFGDLDPATLAEIGSYINKTLTAIKDLEITELLETL